MGAVDVSKTIFQRVSGRTAGILSEAGGRAAARSMGMGALKGAMIGGGLGAATGIVAGGLNGDLSADSIQRSAVRGAVVGGLMGGPGQLGFDLARRGGRLSFLDGVAQRKAAARMDAGFSHNAHIDAYRRANAPLTQQTAQMHHVGAMGAPSAVSLAGHRTARMMQTHHTGPLTTTASLNNRGQRGMHSQAMRYNRPSTDVRNPAMTSQSVINRYGSNPR
jgi:hypothetical protein